MNEIICKKSIVIVIMISCVLMGCVGYQTIAGFEKPSPITTTEDPNVQLNRLYEAVKNGGNYSGPGKTNDDLLISNSNGGVEKQDDRGNINPTRQNQRQNTTNGGAHKDYEIGVGHTIRHGGYEIDSPVQDYVQYAYDLGGMDLVLLLQCEQHRDFGEKSPRENSYGFCQINKDYYPDIVNNEKFGIDRKREIEQCKSLRDNGTPFFGPDRPNRTTGKKCYIEDQKWFTFANQN